jgi:hypothetical protein
MATYRFALLTLPLAAASLALGACGGGGSEEATAGSGDQRAEAREAALDFAKCMREHGVDMPDPQPGEAGIMLGGPDMDADRATMERAQKACQDILEKVRPPELSPEQEQEFKERALKFAKCMREQGIDYPDPTFEDGGRMTQRLEGGGMGPDNPRFREAMEECSEFEPRMRRFEDGS